MSIMQKKKQNFRNVLSNQWFMAKLCFGTTPFFMCYLIFEAVKLQISIFFEHTIGIQYVLHTAETGGPFFHAVQYLVVIAFCIEISAMCTAIFIQHVSLKQKPKLYKALKKQLFAKAKELDLSCYDDPVYYNDFVLAVSEAEKSLDRFLELVKQLFTSLTIFITIGIFIFTQDAWGSVFVLLSFVLSFIATQIMKKLNFKIRLLKNPIERKRAYNHRVFYLNDYAKELRLNPSVSEILYEDFDKTNDEIYDITKKHVKKLCWLGFFKNYLARDFITDGLYAIYLVYRTVVLHVLSYSTMVILFNSINRCRRSLNMLAELFPMAAENSLYIDKIMNFLAYEPKIKYQDGIEVPKEPKCLELRNVSFAYNNKDGNILKNINMTLHPNEKIAIVGYNGAGKTTLIKLIMRLYDTTGGDIYYDGVNIKDYELSTYRSQIGAVFQDYKLYAATLQENVLLDICEPVSDNNKSISIQEIRKQHIKERVITALVESGFGDRLSTLKEGLDTHLSTEFDENGVSFSGGESQKVAIARVFYKNANLIILDEPSSALDPVAEYNLNKAMYKMAQTRSVIYISHRLSTTRAADRIYMLEDGSIIESGTHRELLGLDGKYAKMWNAQAGRYR
jgi:ATP-binding cassette, subfamily B, bacterial